MNNKIVFYTIQSENPKQWENIDITKSIEIPFTIRAKKKGTLLEKCLYYSKRKRINKGCTI